MASVIEVDMGSQYLRNVAAQGIGRAVSFGANFVSFVIIARIGGTELFGQYSYVLTFLGIFAAAADFGMCTVLGKDIAQVRQSADSIGETSSFSGRLSTLPLFLSPLSPPSTCGGTFFRSS